MSRSRPAPTRPVRRARRRSPAPAFLAALALAATLTAPPAAGQEPAPVVTDPVPGVDRPVVHDPRVADALAAVPVTGPALTEAYARYRADHEADRRARDDEVRARAELVALTEARARLVTALNQANRRHDKSAGELVSLRRSLAAIAVRDYVHGSAGAGIELDLDAGAATEARARRTVSAAVRGHQIDDVRAHEAALARAVHDRNTATAELADVAARERESTAALDDAVARQARLATALGAGARAVADARLTADVSGADFVLVALDAYHKAAARMAVEQPACRIHWTLLAGVGRTESWHGTYGGGRLEPGGRVSRPIIGIPLDGTNGTARITDTDGGHLDGDPAVDRAVGPMQFIPSTWARWGRDNNGDGAADPQNLYDAAAAAAAYLCAGGGALDTDAGQRTAVFRYNLDHSYVDTVVSRARSYQALRLV